MSELTQVLGRIEREASSCVTSSSPSPRRRGMPRVGNLRALADAHVDGTPAPGRDETWTALRKVYAATA